MALVRVVHQKKKTPGYVIFIWRDPDVIVLED
jgi:hypothetical protein